MVNISLWNFHILNYLFYYLMSKENFLPLIKGRNIPFEKLSQVQKEYIANLNKEKKLLRKYKRK